MDELAREIDVTPRLSSLILENPSLATRCFLGPCVPAQYRLRGPDAWPGAEKTIRNALSNNVSATRTRRLYPKEPLNKRSNPSTSVQLSALLTDRRVLHILLVVLLWNIICRLYQYFLNML